MILSLRRASSMAASPESRIGWGSWRRPEQAACHARKPTICGRERAEDPAVSSPRDDWRKRRTRDSQMSSEEDDRGFSWALVQQSGIRNSELADGSRPQPWPGGGSSRGTVRPAGGVGAWRTASRGAERRGSWGWPTAVYWWR